MKTHVLLADDPEGAFADELRAVLPEEIVLTVEKEPVACGAASILIAGRPAEELLTASPNLKWLIIPFAGVPSITLERLDLRPDIQVANLHHNAAATAEHALGLLLTAAKGIVPADRELRQNNWQIRYKLDTGLQLAGRSAVVLGYGAIGRRIARALRGLDVQVSALVRNRDRHQPTEDQLFCVDQLDTQLAEADFLINALPETRETKNLIDARRIGLLSKSTVLVNVGRASAIAEEALYEALRDHRIYAAGIDVWYRYPENEEGRTDTAPSSFPFGDLGNVVLSPHRAGHAAGIDAERAHHCSQLILTIAQGEVPIDQIDRDIGY